MLQALFNIEVSYSVNPNFKTRSRGLFWAATLSHLATKLLCFTNHRSKVKQKDDYFL